jgi:hypothetical protein
VPRSVGDALLKAGDMDDSWEVPGLVNVYSLRTWKWPSRHSGFTQLDSMVIFYSYVKVYQRVFLLLKWIVGPNRYLNNLIHTFRDKDCPAGWCPQLCWLVCNPH